MNNFWDDRYAENEFVYGVNPNEFFKETIDKLEAGKMLLPCEGEGRNAVYAALKNWEVDSFDLSIKGKEKCLLLAEQNDVSINYQIADALAFDYGEKKYDAIALIYAHFPPNIRYEIHQKCIKALKTGGILILEAFNPLQINNTSGGPTAPALLYSIEMLNEDFKELTINSLEYFTVNLDEGKYHSGKADIIRLIATKAN